jgi:hypothetical protein
VGLGYALIHLGATATTPLFGNVVDVTGSDQVSWGLLMLWLLLGVWLLGMVGGNAVTTDTIAKSRLVAM